MSKSTTKKKKSSSGRLSESSSRNSRSSDHSPKVFDEDMEVFIEMALEMKEEGTKLFQRRDYEGAIFKYQKAIKLLPKTHIDVAYVHSNIAACYMHMKPEEYHRAIDECNLALEASPKYTKALVKRARCFEALNRLDMACRDVDKVLSLEPNNFTALEISERVKTAMEKKGITLDKEVVPSPENFVVNEKLKRKKSRLSRKSMSVRNMVFEEDIELRFNEKWKLAEVKEEPTKEEPTKAVKLVFGEDIRCAQMPANCSISQLREIVLERFPSMKGMLVKFRDKEDDLVTITTSEDLRLAEESADPHVPVRLYVTEADPEQALCAAAIRKDSSVRSFDRSHYCMSENGSTRHDEDRPVIRKDSSVRSLDRSHYCMSENGSTRYDEDRNSTIYVDDWMLQFAKLFKNHVGFDSDAYLDLHDLGMKLYYEAMDDAVTSEEAQEIFQLAEAKFQEMAALALFNWGNVHMSRARKRLSLPEDASRESVLAPVKTAYEWACAEYVKASMKYGEALKMKPDFYEGFIALGQQYFEHAKLSWYYALACDDLGNSSEVLELFNNAEDNMEKGMEMWERMEVQRLKERSKPNKETELLEKVGLEGYLKDVSADDAAEHASTIRSQINILWGTMLYERSIVEYKLGLPSWEECLTEAVEKFKLAGASVADISVMIKNHCANETTQDGLSFKIDEIIQAWNEMYDAKKWRSGVSSFHLEPLFRRRPPKLHHILEHLHYT